MPDRRRVLVITPDFPPATGGIQLLIHRVVAHLQEHDARVVTLDTTGAAASDHRLEADVRRVSPRLRWHPGSVAALNVRALREALDYRPDVVLSAHIVGAPAAASIGRLLKVPFVQYLHAKELGARPTLTSFAVRRAAACIAVSGHTAAMAERAGAPPSRIHQIPPGVDPAPPRQAERSAAPTILTVARLEDRYKGHDVVARALPIVLASVPDARWVVVGQGPLRDYIGRLTEITGVRSAVEFRGEVTNAERDAWLDRAHVFTMPSRLPRGGEGGEGFGIVYLEAGSHGTPVVAGNVGGAVDAVKDGETGLLVNPTSALAVARALRLVLQDAELRDRLGRGGQAWAAEHRWDRIAPRVEAVLRSVVG